MRSKAPALKPFPTLTIPAPECIKLSDNLLLQNLNLGEQPVNRIVFSWRYADVAHLNQAALAVVMQMLGEGAGGKTGAEISELLDYHGAWMKTGVGASNIHVSFYSLNESFEKLLPTILDTVFSPDFPEDALAHVAERMGETAKLNRRNVSFIAHEQSRKHLFGSKHPLAHVATPEDFASLTRDDVLRQYQASMQSFVPDVYIAGQTDGLIEPLSHQLVERVEHLPEYPERTIIPMSPEPGVYHTTLSGSNQAAVSISVPTINRDHPDYIDLRLAIIALGGYFGSRLMSNIREDKGYIYGIYSALMGYAEGGAMSVNCQADPRYVEPLIEEVRVEIEKLSTIPMSNGELEALKSHCMSTLAAELDDPFTIMDYHITTQSLGIPEGYYSRQIAAINSLTPARICEVMSRHIDLTAPIIDIVG